MEILLDSSEPQEGMALFYKYLSYLELQEATTQQGVLLLGCLWNDKQARQENLVNRKCFTSMYV